MSGLRASQIETLGWLRLHAGTDGVTARIFGNAQGISSRAAERRFDGLIVLGLVERIVPALRAPRYRLTNQGRTALEEAGK
jgi:hypothetical protein